MPENGPAKRKIGYLTRTELMSCGHRLNSAFMNPEENLKTFGKCNTPNGHGHNYKIDVTVRGPVDKVTGMVMNLLDLAAYMKEVIMNNIDHRNLDKDLEYFNNGERTSTVENISVLIWDLLKPKLPPNVEMFEIRIEETEKNSFYYRGEEC